MGYNNGIITAPVSVYDVQRAVSRSNSDVGNLIVNGTINKWAKYKPVVLNQINTTDQLENNNSWKANSTWWKGTNGNCGITFTTFSTIDAVKTAIDNHAIVWGYQRPSGGSVSPYRLVDFNLYNLNALPPIYDVSAGSAVCQAGATLKIMAARSPATSDNITLADIGDFSNYYFTVAIYQGNTLKIVHSASSAMGTLGDVGDIELEIPYNDGVNGGYEGVLIAGNTYAGYAFLSSVQYTCATSAQSGVYVPLPDQFNDFGIGSFSVVAISDSQWLAVDAYVIGTGTVVNWTAYMYGTTTGQTGTISLVDLNGTTVSGQTYSINFANGTPVSNPTGLRLQSGLSNSLIMPSFAPENYRVKLESLGYQTILGVIGYEAQT